MSGIFYIKCKTTQQCERLQLYLNEETRPDLPEEVPTEEADWVEPFEFMEQPDNVTKVTDKDLLITFYPDETDFTEDAESFIKILVHTVGIASVLYGELGEDWTTFELIQKQKRTLLWSVEVLPDPDERQYNQHLSKEEKVRLISILYDDEGNQSAEEVLLELAAAT